MGMRKQFTNEFKAKVAMEALKGIKTMSELASEYGVHPTQIASWKGQLKDHASEVFGNPHDKSSKEQKELIDQLYKNIGRMQIENDWLKKKLDI